MGAPALQPNCRSLCSVLSFAGLTCQSGADPVVPTLAFQGTRLCPDFSNCQRTPSQSALHVANCYTYDQRMGKDPLPSANQRFLFNTQQQMPPLTPQLGEGATLLRPILPVPLPYPLPWAALLIPGPFLSLSSVSLWSRPPSH